MADAGNVETGDTILEIGPGTGALTRELLKRGATVIAVEADVRAVDILSQTFANELAEGKLVLHHTDIRSTDLQAFELSEHAYKVVANIPYYLSGTLFRTFLSSELQPSLVVFLVQREVAERIARDPKESLLSLSVKVYGDPQYIGTVKPGNFTPPPAVDSAIIAIQNITRSKLHDIDEALFFSLLHLGFGSRRKQLLGNLSTKYSRDVLTHIFSTCSISLSTRGEDLSVEKWLELTRALKSTT